MTMLKKELLKMRSLKATKKMMQLAENDTPVKVKRTYGSYTYEEERRKYGLYMRCVLQGNVLKVSVFLPDAMRLGGRKPAYEVFIDRKNDQFITFNCSTKKWMDSKLDRIDWPSSVYHCDERWISTADNNTIKQYLGNDGGYGGILSYQYSVRDKQLAARHKKETDPWDADMTQIPPLPKDWAKWVRKVGIPENFIFYNYSKKGVHTGYCSYCEKDVPIRQPRYNKVGRCPCCGHEVTYKSVKRFSRLWTKRASMYLIQRCRDGFVIRFFDATAYYSTAKYKTPEVTYRELRRALYDPNGKPLRAYYWGMYKQRFMRWIPGSVCPAQFGYYSGDYPGRVYGKTLPDLSRKELARTGLPEIIKNAVVDPEHYLAVLNEIPLLEKLSKAQLPRLACECVGHYYKFKERFGGSTATSLTGILGITPLELKRLRTQNGGLRFLDWMRFEKAAQTMVPDDVAAWFCAEKIEADDLKFIQGKMSPLQICNYIRRQMAENGMNSKEIITTWADYLAMARRFGMDTDDEIVYRVRKLKKRHDELAKRGVGGKSIALRAGKILLEYPHVEEIMQAVKGKYEYVGKDYLIAGPSSIDDVLQESDHLSLCISNSDRYWDRIEQKESYLLFLRKAAAPDKPYYMLEVEPNGTIRQIRTYYDRQQKDVEAARVFLKSWQSIVAKRLDEEDRALAQASKVLRDQEFVQMKRDQVIIRTGDLAGKLLADVLAADLMEAAA